MKINKKFVQEVANGKYCDYDTRGEMQRTAQRILDGKLTSKFAKFCFRIYGSEMPDNEMDVYDAFVEFAGYGAAVTVWNTKEDDKVYKFGGMTPEESLKRMNEWIWRNHDAKGYQWLEDCEYRMEGMPGKYHLHLTYFHYCFVKGRISEKDILKGCRAA